MKFLILIIYSFNSFQYVLNVTPDLPNVFEASGGIQYLQIPITDHYSQDLAMHFPAAIKFIGEYWQSFFETLEYLHHVSTIYQ